MCDDVPDVLTNIFFFFNLVWKFKKTTFYPGGPWKYSENFHVFLLYYFLVNPCKNIAHPCKTKILKNSRHSQEVLDKKNTEKSKLLKIQIHVSLWKNFKLLNFFTKTISSKNISFMRWLEDISNNLLWRFLKSFLRVRPLRTKFLLIFPKAFSKNFHWVWS